MENKSQFPTFLNTSYIRTWLYLLSVLHCATTHTQKVFSLWYLIYVSGYTFLYKDIRKYSKLKVTFRSLVTKSFGWLKFCLLQILVNQNFGWQEFEKMSFFYLKVPSTVYSLFSPCDIFALLDLQIVLSCLEFARDYFEITKYKM